MEKLITALTINYNTPDYLRRLIRSFRRFYDIPFLIIDGSDKKNFNAILNLQDYDDVQIYHVDFNIHHGPGMAKGFQIIKTDQILVLDSDLEVLRGGFVEDLQSKLNNNSYGIGDIQIVNDEGFNSETGIEYLHPACMLINREIALQYPLPIRHGAPMIETMKALRGKGLLQHANWVTNDFREPEKQFIRHDWKGTVNAVGGYGL